MITPAGLTAARQSVVPPASLSLVTDQAYTPAKRPLTFTLCQGHLASRTATVK